MMHIIFKKYYNLEYRYDQEINNINKKLGNLIPTSFSFTLLSKFSEVDSIEP